jgi:phosphate-selective porin OprO/OprP
VLRARFSGGVTSVRRYIREALGVIALLFPAFIASAQTPAPAPTPTPSSPYDNIWRKVTEWYRDDSNPVVQRVLLSGRLHFEYADLDADQGNHSEWNVRRWRIGPRITLFRTVIFHGEVELDPQRHDPFYERFTDLYVQWTKSPRFVLTVGKQGAPFTLDGATSSRELLTIDRSNLANNIWFPQEYLPGVSVSGRRSAWVYRTGLYSAGEANRELGEFTGGAVVLGVLGYDFAPALGAREALLSGNYVYQHPDPDNTFTRELDHIGSINFRLETTKYGFRSDLAAASGYFEQTDLWAFQAMPFYNVTDKAQLVARYTFVGSGGPDGIRLATYESRVVSDRGDEFHELYFGANYYLYGHRLKLQTGLQFGDMNDSANNGGAYSGLSWTTGLRLGW